MQCCLNTETKLDSEIIGLMGLSVSVSLCVCGAGAFLLKREGNAGK